MQRSFTYILLTLCLPLVAPAQGLPHYEVQMDSLAYDLLYTRDIFSDSLLQLTAVHYPSSLSPARTDGWIRFKGHSTRYYPKKAYRLKFDADFTTPIGPARSVNLNAMYTDKSFIRENFCWLAYADIGALVPGATYATATINGHYKGIFLQVDKIDKYFLTNRGRARAPMYEAEDLYAAADLTVQPDSVLKLYYAKEIGDENDYSDLASMIAALNGADQAIFPAVLTSLFDLRSVLNWFAVNVLATEGDSYNKNYYLYRDTTKATGQWTIIPWDYDLSCGREGDITVPYPWDLLNDLFVYTYEPLAGPSNVLKDRFLQSPVLMEMFRAYLDSLLTSVWTVDHLTRRIDSLASFVEPYVQGDPDKWGTVEDFVQQIEALKYYVVARRNCIIATFTQPVGGEYDQAVIRPAQLNIPYHAVAVDGRQLATLTFHSMSGLDSVEVIAHPDERPPQLTDPTQGYINRWIEILPYPSTARFQAALQWMWMEPSVAESEVVGTMMERNLICHYYVPEGAPAGYLQLPSHINAFANFVNAEISDTMCGDGKHFAAFTSTPTGASQDKSTLSFDLHHNYPNPFNPITVISYQLPMASDVQLVVYDLLGREIAVLVDERKGAGGYAVEFNAAGLASGVYLCQLRAGDFVTTRRMVLTR